MRIVNKIKIQTASIQVSKALHKKAETKGMTREKLTSKVRHVIQTGRYAGIYRDQQVTGQSFVQDGLNVVLDEPMRKVVKILRVEKKEAEQKQLVPLGEFEQVIGEMKALLKKTAQFEKAISSEISSLDKQISSIYHDMETNSFNASQGYQFAKKLQMLLRKRRIAKGEFQKFTSSRQELQMIEKNVASILQKTADIQAKQNEYVSGWDHSADENFSRETV